MLLKRNSMVSLILFLFGLTVFVILQIVAYEDMYAARNMTDAYMRKMERNSLLKEISICVLVFTWCASNLISLSCFKQFKNPIIKVAIVIQTILTAIAVMYMLLFMTSGGFM